MVGAVPGAAWSAAEPTHPPNVLCHHPTLTGDRPCIPFGARMNTGGERKKSACEAIIKPHRYK